MPWWDAVENLGSWSTAVYSLLDMPTAFILSWSTRQKVFCTDLCLRLQIQIFLSSPETAAETDE